MNGSRVLAATLLLMVVLKTDGHPQCLDFKPPFRPSEDFAFCQEYQSLSCCNATTVVHIRDKFNDIVNELTEVDRNECGAFIRDMLCQICSPYAAHLYDTEDPDTPTKPIPGLCPQYCLVVFKCRHLIGRFAESVGTLAQIDDVEMFCGAMSASDPSYCYPDLKDNADLTDSIGTVRFYQRNSSCVKMCVKEVANDLYSPVSMKHANDGSHRIFIVEQRGVVWVFRNDWSKLSVPFLDIVEKVETEDVEYDEGGLLDIEFHPRFAHNGKFYIYYSLMKGNKEYTRISEMKLSSDDMNRADHTYERILFEIYQPQVNHNGGQLLFGDDSYLYIFVGDGGGAGDRFGKYGNGQNLTTLLGKVLRINVDTYSPLIHNCPPYTVPATNPFSRHPTFRHEIYAYGVRNMWRCSKDRGSPTGSGKGRIFCGDVGQNKYEEIDIITNGGNYGWRAFEGFACYDKKMCNKNKFTRNLVQPIFAYSHRIGKSVTGGYVYRGCENPNWQGFYFLADFMNGRMIMLQEGTKRWYKRALCLADDNICKNGGLHSFYNKFIQAFGEDEAGEVYFMSGTLPSATYRGGSVYKLVDPSLRGNPTECGKKKVVTRQTLIAEGTKLIPYRRKVEEHPIRLADGRREGSGRVEVFYDNEWGNICGRGWTRTNSDMVCRNLGYSTANSTNFVPVQGKVWLTNVDCIIDNTSFDDCRKSPWGATASCKTIVVVNCVVDWFNE